MSKIILKTALKTLLIVAVVVLVAFGVASLGFPSDMASLCEKSGNYSMATGYASLSYTYSKDVNDLNRCFTDSIYAKNDGNIVKFGDQLIEDEKFPELCESITAIKVKTNGKEIEIPIDYKQYVCGHVAAAKYREGNEEQALETAKTAMADVEGFPSNNALAILSLQVIQDADKGTAKELLSEITANHRDESDYCKVLIDELTKVCGQE